MMGVGVKVEAVGLEVVVAVDIGVVVAVGGIGGRDGCGVCVNHNGGRVGGIGGSGSS